MNKIDLSIIIPHYNSPKLLYKLLKSIPILNNIEVIVIDDKSNRYLNELNKLKNDEQFNHVKFLYNQTSKKGAGTCRNIGLKHANGEWLLFADSDDFFVENFYNIVSKYFKTNNEVVFFTPTSIYIENNTKAKRHIAYEKLIIDYINKKENSDLFLRFYFRTPTSKMINRNFLINNNIYFSEVIVCNDDFFSVKVGFNMIEFIVTKEIIYCITDSQRSLSKKRGEKYFWSCFDENIKIYEFVKNILCPQDFEKVKIYGLPILYRAIKNYSIGLSDLFEAYIKLKKQRIPFYSLKKLFRNLMYLKRK